MVEVRTPSDGCCFHSLDSCFRASRSGRDRRHAGQVTVEAMDRDLAVTRATSRVPQGKTVTDTSCEVIDVADIDHYRCTVSWD